MRNLYFLICLIFFITILSCNQNPSQPKGMEYPKTSCEVAELHSTPIISYGFEYKDVRVVRFRTYKKNTNFQEFLTEYKSVMAKDFLAVQKPDSYENKRKERTISIPIEITTEFDIMICIPTKELDTLKYKITNMEAGWQSAFPGFMCGMTSCCINGKDGAVGNIHIFKPGFYLRY